MTRHIIALALLATALPALAQEVTTNTFRIDPAARYQTIEHFGASDAWYSEAVGTQFPEEERERFARLLFSTGVDDDGQPEGIGLSLWRFNIGGGTAEQGEASRITDPHRRVKGFLEPDGSYNWDDQPGQRWFVQAAARYGVEHFVGFVNSPPVNWTRNGLGRKTENDQRSNLKPEHYSDYARFLADVAEHFRDVEGVELDWISPVNEPQWDWNETKQEGTPTRNGELTAIVREIAAEFERRGVGSKIIIPECAELNYAFGNGGHFAGNQIAWFFDPASEGYVGGLKSIAPAFAGHSYFINDSDDQMVRVRQRLRRAIEGSATPLSFWMSEYCILSNNALRNESRGRRTSAIDCAILMAKVIHADLTVANAVTWQFWTAMSPNTRSDRNTRYDLIALDLQRQTGVPTKLLWALGHYSRFVRPGMQRIGVEAVGPVVGGEPLHDVLVSAYATEDNAKLVVVAVNRSLDDQPLRLEIAGAGDVEAPFVPYVTTADPETNLRRGEEVAADAITLPARSIVTLVRE